MYLALRKGNSKLSPKEIGQNCYTRFIIIFFLYVSFQDGQLIEELDISSKKREELNQMMLDRGFKLKGEAKKEEEEQVAGHDEV